MDPLLRVRDLRLSLQAEERRVTPVDGVSFTLEPGECVGLVGESGCGKSLTAMSLTGLTRSLSGAQIEGEALWLNRENVTIDLTALRERQLSYVRGGEIATVFQDPLSALNPLMRVDAQLEEVLNKHRGLKGKAAFKRTCELLALTGISREEERARQYPHQLSGGLRQRVMLAMALAGEPRLLIADEPTTALDVTIQAQILVELKRLRAEHELAILFITHDLGVVAQVCDRILVMYAGRIIEDAPVAEFFNAPRHPYSQGLIASLPSLAASQGGLTSIPGNPPQPGDFPTGCRFHPRCPLATEQCRSEYPPFEGAAAHHTACWQAGQQVESWAVTVKSEAP